VYGPPHFCSDSSDEDSLPKSHSTLGLRELTIYGLRIRPGLAAQEETAKILSLHIARSLVRLRFGWFKGIERPWNQIFRHRANSKNKRVPSALEDIEVIFPQKRATIVEAESPATLDREHRVFIETAEMLFRSYILHAPNLKRLKIRIVLDLAKVDVPPLALQQLCQI
jgi:hypothetical protein